MRTYLPIAILSLICLSPFAFGLAPSIIAACNECHGPEQLKTNPKMPSLNGQHKRYFLKQLTDMKTKLLHCPNKMARILSQLSPQDMEDLAQFYAKIPQISGKKSSISNQRGQKIYNTGDYEKQITACIICHGPSGRGNDQAGFPVLAGQSSTYIREELHAFKCGRRKNDLNQIMRTICSKMSEDDIKDIADYIEQF